MNPQVSSSALLDEQASHPEPKDANPETLPCPPHCPRPAEVLAQLERMVQSSHFRNSRRYPALLRFLVEETLAGRGDQLKERTLGMEVFGRPADYDTNADPVVRVTAGEVRKRIAQYYQSPGHEREIRFELPLGSYHPQFNWPATAAIPSQAQSTETPVSMAPASMAPASMASVPVHGVELQEPLPPDLPRTEALVLDPLRSRGMWWMSGLALLIAVLVGARLAMMHLHQNQSQADLYFFWRGLLRSDEPVLIVLGAHNFNHQGNELTPAEVALLPRQEPTPSPAVALADMVPISDVVSYGKIIGPLTQNTHRYRTQSATETTYEDLGRGPVILIGGFNNLWSMRLTAPLRFHLATDAQGINGIADSSQPQSAWKLYPGQEKLNSFRDYALVSCFFDPKIDQYVLVAAGIGKNGTEAAASFLSQPKLQQAWLNGANLGSRENVEIVLSTDVIEGKHGPPHLVTSYAW